MTDWNWTNGGPGVIAGGIDGSWCAQVEPASVAGNYSSQLYSVSVAVAVAATYAMRVWLSGGTPEVYVRRRGAGASDEGFVAIGATGDVHAGYTKYEVASLVVPAGTETLALEAYNQSAAAAMLADAVSLVEV